MKRSNTKKEIQVPSDLALVQGVSQEILDFLAPISLSEGILFDIRLSLEEALINAMKYGNKLDKSLTVGLLVEYDDSAVRISIEDRGDGFDVKALRDCTSSDNLFRNCGRGVYLIHQLMDEVHYNDKGNCVLMIKQLKGSFSKNL